MDVRILILIFLIFTMSVNIDAKDTKSKGMGTVEFVLDSSDELEDLAQNEDEDLIEFELF